VVHEFATEYFSLPHNHTKVIEDAVTYTNFLAEHTNQRYDYIVHDVFTGGVEPSQLYTIEFMKNLDKILKPDGVIAIVSVRDPRLSH
jgi:spermidine synthase